MIRGAIFDMDGVVLDSMGIWRDLGLRYLAAKNVPADHRLIDVLFSMSMEQAGLYLHENYLPALSPASIVSELAEMVRVFYFEEVTAKEGVEDVLKAYHSQGVSMIVLTSSPRSFITAALTRLGLLKYFQAILTTGEIGESKHSPLGFIMAQEKLGTKKEETVVWEDSLYALQTAGQAGFHTVAVKDAQGEPDQEGLKAAAEVYLETPGEFLKK